MEWVVVRVVTASDNHLTYSSDPKEEAKSFVLSRTASSDQYAKPEYVAKGYTWYIREVEPYGKDAVAYFKDVEMALHALGILQVWEYDCEDEGFDIAHDLEGLRRMVAAENEWHLLEAL